VGCHRPDVTTYALDVLTDVLQRRWVDEPAIEHPAPAEIELV
jgi:hypothetical protein